MGRVCSDCGRPVLVKNTGREHNDLRSYTYRCKDCVQVRVDKLIEETRRALGLRSREPS